MGDWPAAVAFPGEQVAISPYGPASIGAAGGVFAAPASTAWPTANKALLYPFRLSKPIQITKLYVHNGTAVSGNVDIGIYGPKGARLASTGSTAQAGTSALQVIALGSALSLDRGLYYLALALDNTTGTVFRSAPLQALLQALGMAEMASAFPLPASVTLASLSAAFLPNAGLFARSSP